MKKNIVALVIGLTMVFAMAGCGAAETEATVPTETVETVESTETTSTEETVETETVEPTETIPVETEVVEPTETEAAPAETETEVVEPTETVPAETEVAEPEFTVTEMSGTKYASKSVNVRKGPSTDYDKVGVLALNEEITITGQADNGWFEFDMDGEKVYVSDKYVSDNKTEIKQVAKNETPAEVPVESIGEGSGSGMPGIIIADADTPDPYAYDGDKLTETKEETRANFIKNKGWEPGNSYVEYVCDYSGGFATCAKVTYYVISESDYTITEDVSITAEEYIAAGGVIPDGVEY